MIKRFENHPMYGKKHTEEVLALISKPGESNPMYNKKHSEQTKAMLSKKKNKYPLLRKSGVGIFDLAASGDGNLIFK